MRGALILLLSMVTSVAPAQKEAGGKNEKPDVTVTDPVYGGGSLKLRAGTVAKLDTSDDQFMKITWHEGDWKLPYSRIQVLYVSLSRPSAMVELAGISYVFLLGALKDRKAYLSVQYEDDGGLAQKCFFFVPLGAGEQIGTLAKRAKRTPVYESEEARRRVQGRK